MTVFVAVSVSRLVGPDVCNIATGGGDGGGLFVIARIMNRDQKLYEEELLKQNMANISYILNNIHIVSHHMTTPAYQSE